MVNINAFADPNLETHIDDRGKIQDIFYNKSINHVAIIESLPNVIRGNHYHKETTQHILILEGSLEYWSKVEGSKSKMVIAQKDDLISTPPFEIHALKILNNGCKFIVFSEGKRGGKDYESDTFRTNNIINE